MEQYISKSAVVAEIEKRRNICKKVVLDLRTEENKDYYQGKAEAYGEVLDYLDTLEVKEVVSESEQRIKECPYRQVGCTMYADKILECTGACSWVVDYLNLKKLKAQKGE